MPQPLEQIMPYIARQPTDKEWTLAMEFLGYWSAKPGLTDDEAEIAMAIGMSMYFEHRRLMGDYDAPKRFLQNVDKAKQFKRDELVTGEHGIRRFAAEYESGRRRILTKEEKIAQAMDAGGWSEPA